MKERRSLDIFGIFGISRKREIKNQWSFFLGGGGVLAHSPCNPMVVVVRNGEK